MWVNLSDIRQWFHRYNTKSISNKREKYINWEFTRIKNICASKYTIKKVKRGTYIPGGPRVKNLPADVGDKDSVPGLGKSHMLWGNQAPASPCAQSLCSKSSLCSKGSLCCKKPQHCNRAAPLAATRENPCTATETQCSRTWINKSHTHTHTHTQNKWKDNSQPWDYPGKSLELYRHLEQLVQWLCSCSMLTSQTISRNIN